MPEPTPIPNDGWSALTARHSAALAELTDVAMEAYLLGIETATNRTSANIDTAEAAEGIGSSRRATDAEQRFDGAMELVHGMADPGARTIAREGVNAAYDLALLRGRAVSSRARRRAAMFGPVLQWRDHTAAVLDSLINAANAQPNPTAALVGAATRAQHPAFRAGVEGAVDAALGQAADGLRLLVQADRDAAAARTSRANLASRVETQDRELADVRRQRDDAEQLVTDRGNALDARDEWAREVSIWYGLTPPEPGDDMYANIGKFIKATVAALRLAEADVTRFKTRLVDDTARLRGHLAKTREERDRARTLVDTLAADQPDGEEETAAENAIKAAWPDLAADPVYVEQLVRTALYAAWEVNHPRRRDVAASYASEAGR